MGFYEWKNGYAKVLLIGLQQYWHGSDIKMALSNFPDNCVLVYKLSNYFTEIFTWVISWCLKKNQMVPIAVFFMTIKKVIANIKLYYIVYCRVFLMSFMKIKRNVYVIYFITVAYAINSLQSKNFNV